MTLAYVSLVIFSLDGAGIEIDLTLSPTLFEYTPWLDKREGSGC